MNRCIRLFVSIFFLLVIILPSHGNQKVYVIHGYASPKSVMKKINKCLINDHFITENFAYKSMREDLDSIGKQLYLDIKNSDFDTVSFVTHSMGGLVVRSMMQYSLSDEDFPVIYRIVMITPPNTGAEIADFYASLKLLDKLLGPNVEYMKTDTNSYVHKLPIPQKSEVGVIVGIRGKKRGYNPFIKGDNDGLLTPQRTMLNIENDIIFIKKDHLMITQKRSVCRLCSEFLKSGKFITKN